MDGYMQITHHVVNLDENNSPSWPRLHFYLPVLGEALIPQIPSRPDSISNENNKQSETLSLPDADPYQPSLL